MKKKYILYFIVIMATMTFSFYTLKAESPQLFTNNCKLEKSSLLLNDVEIRIDSLVIPALTVGELKEIRYNDQGSLTVVVIEFLSTNKTSVSLLFILKKLVDKKSTQNPQSFILRGKAEIGYKYRFKTMLETIPSISRESEDCTLLFVQ